MPCGTSGTPTACGSVGREPSEMARGGRGDRQVGLSSLVRRPRRRAARPGDRGCGPLRRLLRVLPRAAGSAPDRAVLQLLSLVLAAPRGNDPWGDVVSTYEQGVLDGLTAALRALDGHGFHDTAHDRIRRLLACDECGHQPEKHVDMCVERVPRLPGCHCIEYEVPALLRPATQHADGCDWQAGDCRCGTYPRRCPADDLVDGWHGKDQPACTCYEAAGGAS